MQVLGVIPARGGSKSLKYESIKKLKHEPLLWYVANAARQSDSITRLVCSTEDDRIATECRRQNLEVLPRPDELASDDAGITEVLRHAVRSLSKNENYSPQLVVRLLPTHPFIQPSHIDKLVGKIQSTQNIQSGQTLIKVPHHFHMYNQRTIEDGKISYEFKEEREKHPNRQSKPDTYGSGNVCITKSSALLSGESHFAEPAVGMEINQIYALDIDRKEDLELAEWYLKTQKVTIP